MKIKKHFKLVLTACMCTVLMISPVYANDIPQYHAMSPAETMISISSDAYAVDNTNFNIKSVPALTTAGEFILSLDIANGGNTRIMRQSIELTSSDELASGDVLRAYTADFAGYADYVISFEDELTYGTGPVVKIGNKALSEEAPGYYESGGNAWTNSSVVDEDGNPARTLGVSAESDEIWASWRPVIETTGEYEVFYWQGYHATQWSDVANYNIHHADENGDLVTVNKKITNVAGASGWVSLGTYKFTEGTQGYVSLHRVGSNYKACKAAGMKFVYSGGVGVTCNSTELGDGGVFGLTDDAISMSLNFDKDLDTADIEEKITLMGNNGYVALNSDYDSEQKTLSVTTADSLMRGTRYILTVSRDITALNGAKLVRDYVYVFDITAENCNSLTRCIIPYSDGNIAQDYAGADTLAGAASITADADGGDYLIVMCCFDSDKALVDFDTQTVSLASGQSDDVQLTVDASGGAFAEIYVWDGTDFYALCDSYTIEING